VKAQLETLVSHMYRHGMPFEEAVREFQRVFILTVLRDNKGNQCRASKKLGMHRNTLHRTIRSLQLDLLSVRAVFRRRPPRGQALNAATRRATGAGA
jgi:DNA-binding NtrC family response regulator